MKNLGFFFLLALWFLGVFASLGYAIFYKEDYPIVIGLCVVAVFSVPTVKKLWKIIWD